MITAEAVGLAPSEAATLVAQLGRTPNDLEWGLVGALWSEHCSYKSSRAVLAWLAPPAGSVVQGPGENAGVVRLDRDFDVAFKVESHNHPSYVEPFHGAATGVGGIIRDVLAMGARPIAVLDSLHFGPTSTALADRVVAGIGFYGNAIGVPTVGGEVTYADGYAGNPLVNVCCVGIRRSDRPASAAGSRVGDRLLLVGARTGRDGIHGASLLASRVFDDQASAMRPAVQVGDPFTGKLVLESVLAALATGRVHAVQDLGAAGLSSATAEMAQQAGRGIRVDVSRVPRRESGLSAYEVMLSETQERMLLAVAPGDVDRVAAVIRAGDVSCVDIGEVVADGQLTVVDGDRIEARLPVSLLGSGAPRRQAPPERPGPRPPAPPHRVVEPFDAGEALRVLSHRECRSKAGVFRQYDFMVQTHTVVGPGGDAAVLRIAAGHPGIAVTVDGPGRWMAVDAYAGGARAVLEAVMNLTAVGAEPLGLSDGLNLGSPADPAVYAQFLALTAGIADAAQALGVPVTGGNVSFYNQTGPDAIWPTAVIGAVGRHPRPEHPLRHGAVSPGAWLVRLGRPERDLGATVWRLAVGDGGVGAASCPDWAAARAVLEAMADPRLGPHLLAAHDVADGGLFVSLAEMLLAAEDPRCGLDVELDAGDARTLLFNEGPGQMLILVSPTDAARGALDAVGVEWAVLGRVTEAARLTVRTGSNRWDWERAALSAAYERGEDGVPQGRGGAR